MPWASLVYLRDREGRGEGGLDLAGPGHGRGWRTGKQLVSGREKGKEIKRERWKTEGRDVGMDVRRER